MGNYGKVVFPALAFVFVTIMAGNATLQQALSDQGLDWREVCLSWMTPGAFALALAVGFAMKKIVAHFAGQSAGDSTGSTGDTASPSSPLVRSVAMHVSQFVAGEGVQVSGAIYRGQGVVSKVEGGKVFVRTPEARPRTISFHQGDLDAGKLTKANAGSTTSRVGQSFGVPSQAPAAPGSHRPSVADFRSGDRVSVAGDLYRGHATVVAQRHAGKVSVRTDVSQMAGRSRIISYGQADLDAGKLLKLTLVAAAQVAPPASGPAVAFIGSPPPAVKVAPACTKGPAPTEGTVRLPPGGDVVIESGEFTISIARKK